MSDNPLFQFGPPRDAAAWTALGLAALLFFAPWGRLTGTLSRLLERRRRLLLASAMLTSGLGSFAYFHCWLEGAPRIIDATAYLLEARTLALGQFSFEVPQPSGAFRGRFLIGPEDEPQRLGVIFPPGYPLILALGVRLGSYAGVGPVLAALLVLVTYALGRELGLRREVALLAAAFSVLCACLRYHTADTMSHGWSALLGTTLLHSSLRASRVERCGRLWLAGIGLCAGWLLATRQLTGAVFIVCSALYCLRERPPSRPRDLARLSWLALGALPAVALLLCQQKALTGDYFGSPQLRYYALADGPADCFGLGYGKGCLFEHGPTVAAQGGGLTPLWAARNVLRRFHAHSLDLANFELLFALVPIWLWRKRHDARARLLLAVSLLLPLSYALFYFDGSYPGGGARFLSELLPLGHVALAAALAQLGGRAPRFGLALSLFGFACHGSYSHAHLRQRMEGAGQLPESSASRLLFVEGDHAFLGHFEPSALPAAPGLGPRSQLLARARDATRERALWNTLARPPALRWLHGSLSAWSPAPELGPPIVLEAEAEWPLLDARRLWAHPAHPPGSCVSGGRALRVVPSPGTHGEPPWLVLDAGFVPRGRYRAEAVYWTAERECFREALGELELPALVRLEPSTATPHYLDRVEFSPAAR